ncbi:hypothetical protein VNI00_004992 [Paramarasmius palmivorus]|uniref:DUF6534 domain-containing protein n=1 Tax=Paramarasmius palmivorus TaxID=297713 RepID=A0AAW0DH14_9AGAR
MHYIPSIAAQQLTGKILMQIVHIFLVETANTALQIVVIYGKLIGQAGDPDVVLTVPKLIYLEVPMIIMVEGPVQLFMTWRLKIITGWRSIPALAISLTLCTVAAGVMTGIFVAPTKYYSDWNTVDVHLAATIHGVAAGAADLLLTISLTWVLLKRSRRKSEVGLTGESADKVDYLLRLTVQTGALSATASIVAAVTFFLTPVSFPSSNASIQR